jgi:hypothetical protein
MQISPVQPSAPGRFPCPAIQVPSLLPISPQTRYQAQARADLGVLDCDPEPLPYDPAQAQKFVGTYDSDAMTLVIAADESAMTLEASIKPEIRAAWEGEIPPDYPPAAFGLLPSDENEYIITEGGLKGQRGFFTRDQDGTIRSVDLAGRLFDRI